MDFEQKNSDNHVYEQIGGYSVTDRVARVWGMLWHEKFKLRLNIPDTILFCNGQFHSMLFASKKHRGEIRKKARLMTLDQIRKRLVRLAEADPANVTSFVGVLQQDDTHVAPVTSTAIGRVLRTMGSVPTGSRFANSDFSDQESLDLYQCIRAYVHPLYGLRYITTYRAKPKGGGADKFQSNKDKSKAYRPKMAGRPAKHHQVYHSLHTVAARYTERYQVSAAERGFFDHPFEKMQIDNAAARQQQKNRRNQYNPSNARDPLNLGHSSGSAISHEIEAPDVLIRECDRMTLAVVDYMRRVHGVGIKFLQCEFVQDFTKRMVFHGIVDVLFQMKPSKTADPLADYADFSFGMSPEDADTDMFTPPPPVLHDPGSRSNSHRHNNNNNKSHHQSEANNDYGLSVTVPDREENLGIGGGGMMGDDDEYGNNPTAYENAGVIRGMGGVAMQDYQIQHQQQNNLDKNNNNNNYQNNNFHLDQQEPPGPSSSSSSSIRSQGRAGRRVRPSSAHVNRRQEIDDYSYENNSNNPNNNTNPNNQNNNRSMGAGGWSNVSSQAREKHKNNMRSPRQRPSSAPWTREMGSDANNNNNNHMNNNNYQSDYHHNNNPHDSDSGQSNLRHSNYINHSANMYNGQPQQEQDNNYHHNNNRNTAHVAASSGGRHVYDSSSGYADNTNYDNDSNNQQIENKQLYIHPQSARRAMKNFPAPPPAGHKKKKRSSNLENEPSAEELRRREIGWRGAKGGSGKVDYIMSKRNQKGRSMDSDQIEKHMNQSHTPRGVVSKNMARPPQQALVGWDFDKEAFEKLSKFETQFEANDRLMKGLPRPTPHNPRAARGDFLLFHWRHAARQANKEIVRLNKELIAKATAWAQQEKTLLHQLQVHEGKRAHVSALTARIESAKVFLEQTIENLKSEHEIERKQFLGEIASLKEKVVDEQSQNERLRKKNKEQAAEIKELLSQQADLEENETSLRRQHKILSDTSQSLEESQRNEIEVRNELLHKLQLQNSYVKTMCQQLDLIAEWSDLGDVRELFNKVIAVNEDEELRHIKDFEALRNLLTQHTTEKGWKQKKQEILSSLKRQARGRSDGGGHGSHGGRSGALTVQDLSDAKQMMGQVMFGRSKNKDSSRTGPTSPSSDRNSAKRW